MLKYLITLFLLACWVGPGLAGNRVMKCVSTDGHVSYARSCSQGDTPSQIHMDVYGNTIHPVDAETNTNLNDGKQDTKASSRINAGNSIISETLEITGNAPTSDNGSTGGNSISGSTDGGSTDGGSNGDNDMSTANTGSSTESSSTDTDSITANARSTPEIRNTNTDTTDTSSTTATSTETETIDETVENQDDDNVTDTNTDSMTDSTSPSDDAEPADTGSDDVDISTDTGITLIDISESASDEYDHIVSSILIDQDNVEITVDGYNFGSGPDVILYDRFENGVTDEEIPLYNNENIACWTNTGDLDTRDNQGPLVGCWSEYGTSKPRYSEVAYSGNHSMQIHDNATGMLQFKKNLSNTTEAFITYWVHVPQTENSYFPGTYWYREDGTVGGIGDAKHREFSKDSSWKFNWLLQDGKYDQLNANLVLPTHIGHGIFSLAGNDNILANLGKVHAWWSWDYWNRITVWIKADPGDPLAPGEVLFQAISQDMGFYQASSSVPIFDEDGPTEKYFNSINFPGWIRPGSITEPLYDDVYIATGANAVSRVEIGNNETYRSSSKVEILQIASWHNNEITLLFDDELGLSPLDNGTYLYITDNRGRVNDQGYPLQ